MRQTIFVQLYDSQPLMWTDSEKIAVAALERELLRPHAMERGPEARRAALRRFMEDRGFTVYSWAKASDVSEGSLRHFLNGGTDSLTATTLEKLAHGAGASVAEIMGEAEAKPAAGTIVPWLEVHTELDGRVVIEKASRKSGMRMAKDWVESALGGDPARGRMLRIEGEPHTKDLRSGDVVCIDLMRVVPARDPGLYCIWDSHAVTVRRIQPMPGKPLFRMHESDASFIEVEQERIQIIGRVIWRSGGI